MDVLTKSEVVRFSEIRYLQAEIASLEINNIFAVAGDVRFDLPLLVSFHREIFTWY